VLVVAALGGNALLRRGEPLRADVQQANVRAACGALAPLAGEHRLVITHGNGPQVGLLAVQSDSSMQLPPYPLDVLGAESEGMIGYLLQQGLGNALPDRRVTTLLTQVVVDPLDPAFETPTKPIGPTYSEAEAHELAARHGWTVTPDGPYFRRVVPSPEPLAIVEIETIRLLVDAGVLVVCAGGGGIPVAVGGGGALRGVEAVIDKDLSAALLATLLGADFLLMLTDVPTVERDWGTPSASPIRRATPVELRTLEFPSGSMGPKIEAACRFVETSGGGAAIGSLTEAAAIVGGSAGTLVAPPSAGCDARRGASARSAGAGGA
jgi:carbamate kinase